MTCCPHCKARGVKVHDPVGPSYCGVCGKNWPAELSASIPDERMPPTEVPRARRVEPVVADPQASSAFTARVGDLADRFRSGERFAEQRDWKAAQSGER